jgi:Insertion element 4 transposase N-terminal
MGVMALVFPMTEVNRFIGKCKRASKRGRDLPASLVAYYVM